MRLRAVLYCGLLMPTAVVAEPVTRVPAVTTPCQKVPPACKVDAHSAEPENEAQSDATTTDTAAAFPLINIGRFPVFSAQSKSSDVFQSPDSFYIGGLPTHGWGLSGRAKNTLSRPGSLVVTGQPWGPYNAGAITSILWGVGVDQQNGVANVDWRAGQVPPFDGVAQYVGVTNTDAMIVAPAKFSAHQAIISPGLTESQLSMLRVGMYISTNIINAEISSDFVKNWAGKSYPLVNFYQGIIAGWKQLTDRNGRSITLIDVPAWGNYNVPHGKLDRVPGLERTDSLDTVRSHYGAPMVFIGNDTGETAHNEYLFYDGRKSVTSENNGRATALSHALSDDEVDLRYYATKPEDVTVNGITVSIASMNNSPVGREAMTSGSYLMNLSGDIPNILILDGAADANIIQAHSFYLHGQEGTYYPKGLAKGTTSTRQVQTNFAFTSYADSLNAFNLLSYQKAYGTSLGATNTSYHFGLHADGDNKQPLTTGSNYGEIEWNPKGTWGASIAFCADNENCGLIHDGNGLVHMPNGVKIKDNGLPSGNGLAIGRQPTSHTAGFGLYTDISDTDNLLEVMHGQFPAMIMKENGNVVFGGNVVSTAYFQETLRTPLSSKDECKAGQFTDDRNYHYVCVATNHWKRSALSDF